MGNNKETALRLIDELSWDHSPNADLISMYIPEKRNVAGAGGLLLELRNEEKKAGDIQNEKVRENIQKAIRWIIEHIMKEGYVRADKLPKHGLVIFAAATGRRDGYHQSDLVAFISITKPVDISMYRCDNRFHVDHLRKLI